jgi:hypothetical protein
MNYRDLQNISNLSQQILVEGANEEHNVLNRWPYTSPYLQESTEVDESYKPMTKKKLDRIEKKSQKEKDRITSGESKSPWGGIGNRRTNQMDRVVDAFGKRGIYYSSGRTIGPKISKEKEKENRARGTQKEQTDLYDIILSHLLDEGYAETQEQAEVIMVNMSEEWRESICEGYVDYRKGKLSTGKSPQQRMSSRLDRIKATATRERGEASSTDSLMTPATKRSQKMGKVKDEMDAYTGVGGVINKALTPGLGNRAGASPRVSYGEPNTDRHQMARSRRGEPSTK